MLSMTNLRQVLVACLCGLSAAVACAQTKSIQQIVAFGDSTIDVGNSLDYFTRLGTPYPIAPYYTGRFSNGPNYVDKVAAGLGLTVAASAAGGYDYAVGGATTGRWGALAQAQHYLARTGGVANPGALYVIQTGENDLEGAAYYYAQTGDLAGANALVDAALVDMSQLLTTLRTAGAVRFMVGNLHDVGRQPGWEATAQRALLRTLAQRWNAALKVQLDGLAAQPGMRQVVRLDMWGMLEWSQLPSNASFTYKTGACLVNGAVCADAHQHVYWDAHHLTTRYHNKLAVQALAVLRQ